VSERQPEDDYFARIDAEKKAKLKAQHDAEQGEAAKEQRRVLHHHKCGKCGADMDTIGFRGVEIEVCGECGAVLLDKGELEELAGSDSSGVIRSVFGSLFSKD
jgi:hypothetical protein